MSTWRFQGELSQGKTREEIKNQSLDGWNPWQHVWNLCEEPGIVVPDPFDPKRSRHAHTYWVRHDGQVRKFAVDHLEPGILRFFVPAAPSDEGAFVAQAPRHEGFWRSALHAEEKLPWPEPQEQWDQKGAFLKMLNTAENAAERVSYRGFSLCRICGCRNGSLSFRLGVWEWPSGFRHYLAEHDVRPSHDFETFVRDYANDKQG